MKSDILFQNIYIEEFHLETNKNFSNSKVKNKLKEDQIETDWEIYEKKEENNFIVVFTLNINKKDSVFDKRPYRISCKALAYFAFDKNIKEDLLHRLIGYESVILIIGTLRGIIKQLTSSAPYGHYLLPAINVKTITDNKYLKEK